jgi:hypothetical protein
VDFESHPNRYPSDSFGYLMKYFGNLPQKKYEQAATGNDGF